MADIMCVPSSSLTGSNPKPKSSLQLKKLEETCCGYINVAVLGNPSLISYRNHLHSYWWEKITSLPLSHLP